MRQSVWRKSAARTGYRPNFRQYWMNSNKASTREATEMNMTNIK